MTQEKSAPSKTTATSIPPKAANEVSKFIEIFSLFHKKLRNNDELL